MKTNYFILILLAQGCASPPPRTTIDLWAGDAQHQSITRSQDEDPDTISCGDERFEDFVCMKYSDLMMLWETVNQCKHW